MFEIPIFPLDKVIILPGSLLPLNIFEKRYLNMIDDCLKTDSKLIGIIQPLSRIKKDLNTYHHAGIYCYEIETLKDFVSYRQSPSEVKYKLEQLRALENKIKINVALAKSHSIGIDTEEDFVAIKKIMEYKSS